MAKKNAENKQKNSFENKKNEQNKIKNDFQNKFDNSKEENSIGMKILTGIRI